MKANELYRKIKQLYPQWEPPKAGENDFSIPPPPITQEQLELLEAGFDVKIKKDGLYYGKLLYQ